MRMYEAKDKENAAFLKKSLAKDFKNLLHYCAKIAQQINP